MTSRRKKVENWLGTKPRRILASSSSDDDVRKEIITFCGFKIFLKILLTQSKIDYCFRKKVNLWKSSHNSSGVSSIIASNLSLLTSQMIEPEKCSNSTIGTQVDESDFERSRDVATQTAPKSKKSKKLPNLERLPKSKNQPDSFNFSTPKRGLSILNQNVNRQKAPLKKRKMKTNMTESSNSRMVPFRHKGILFIFSKVQSFVW